jgi:23S rRNA (cytosine1962-C5)-methyltransferase
VRLPLLRLKKNEERRLLQGHLWVYSNEIATVQTPLADFVPGQAVVIADHRGRELGCGYVNPHTLLCARLLSRNPREILDETFFTARIQTALCLRQMLYPEPYYRLIYGESDYLPGLIVDRYADLLVVQITTAGMEALKQTVLAALEQVVAPAAILLRNDHGMRAVEGLPQTVEAALGEPAQTCLVKENGAAFWISPWSGQKTGWFYDHRENRRELCRWVRGKRVLDVFAYAGAWSIQAALNGAQAVWAVDSSAAALEKCEQNAEFNQVKHLLTTWKNDAFDQLKQFLEDRQQFDVIILDPPAFIKKRKDHAQGLLAYQRLNALALRLLSPDGLLITASCSHHLLMEELQQAVLSGGITGGHRLQILSRGRQGFDHPIHPAIPETEYLKTITVREIQSSKS